MDVGVTDSGPYIASARRHCLFIFALGLVSAQLAWDQSRRQAAQELYGYIEKVLAVSNATETGGGLLYSAGPGRQIKVGNIGN